MSVWVDPHILHWNDPPPIIKGLECHLCGREVSERECSVDADGDCWCQEDVETCYKLAGRRLGVHENKRPPGVIGGKEGQRGLEACLDACRAYRASVGLREPVPVELSIADLFGLNGHEKSQEPVSRVPAATAYLDYLQLRFDLGDE